MAQALFKLGDYDGALGALQALQKYQNETSISNFCIILKKSNCVYLKLCNHFCRFFCAELENSLSSRTSKTSTTTKNYVWKDVRL